MIVLVTGVAGFIGFHTSKKLLKKGYTVVGIDNLNKYYDVKLKKNRIAHLKRLKKKFIFKKIDLKNKSKVLNIFKEYKFDKVFHFAAQAGVRYSLDNPEAYVESNIIAFLNILESCRRYPVKHLISASTSSVYGFSTKYPLSVEQSANHPIQFYAATKKSNEVMGHAYSYLFNIPTTFVRFFTVYGPWGRPDMSLFIFTKRILENKIIPVFNYGNHTRDFTYIDDAVSYVIDISKKIPKKNKIFNTRKLNNFSSLAPFRILNIGNGKPQKLLTFISEIEKNLKIKAKMKMLPLQKGDIKKTSCDMNKTINLIKKKYSTPTKKGVKVFVHWYLEYYKKKNVII